MRLSYHANNSIPSAIHALGIPTHFLGIATHFRLTGWKLTLHQSPDCYSEVQKQDLHVPPQFNTTFHLAGTNRHPFWPAEEARQCNHTEKKV
jgi:hypothetical protein